MEYTILNNSRTGEKISVNFRMFDPEDADAMIFCIREEYGENYFKPDFYNPNYLIELNEKGKIKFLMAETDNGEIAGILALNPSGRMCEISTGIVQKKYRGFKIIRYLFEMAVTEIQKMKKFYAAYCRTVMYHATTQTLMEKINFEPCGFLMAEFLTDDLCNDNTNLKQPHGILIRNISKSKANKIYISDEHNQFIKNIYKSLQVEFEIDNYIYNFKDESQIYFENDELQKSCSIFVNVAGKDMIDKIEVIQNKCSEPLQTFNVFLNLNHKAANFAYEKLKDAGYFFSGIKALCAENEFMVMHNPNGTAINFDKFAVTDKFSKVRDYVKKYYDRRIER